MVGDDGIYDPDWGKLRHLRRFWRSGADADVFRFGRVGPGANRGGAAISIYRGVGAAGDELADLSRDGGVFDLRAEVFYK